MKGRLVMRTAWGVGTIAAAAGLAALWTAAPAAAPSASAVQEAVDRSQIENVVAAAVYAHDRQDDPGLARLLTEDGVFRVDDPERPMNLKAQDMLKPRPGGPAPGSGPPGGTPSGLPAGGSPLQGHHLITNDYVEMIDATNARYIGYYSLVVGNEKGAVIRSTGTLDNRLVKVDGQWKLKAYHLVFTQVRPN